MISQANLPEALIPKCMDILCKIANSERDLIRVVVDVVSELREGEGDEETDMVGIRLGKGPSKQTKADDLAHVERSIGYRQSYTTTDDGGRLPHRRSGASRPQSFGRSEGPLDLY